MPGRLALLFINVFFLELLSLFFEVLTKMVQGFARFAHIILSYLIFKIILFFLYINVLYTYLILN